MTGGLEVTTGSVEAAGGHLSTEGAEYAAAIRLLREGGPGSWGDTGLFAGLISEYYDSVIAGVEAVSRLGDSMDTTGGDMIRAAGRIDESESIGAGEIGKLGDGAWV